ncbi:MAG TPA: hypothetical protein VLM36_11270 [Sphingomicrobium sp.]|nr:hypothetical protein [Sphingomicrobium sp.]
MWIAASLGLIATPAMASPGVGDPVYGATVKDGTTDIEVRYGRLTGRSAEGEDGMVFEAEHAFSSRLSIAGLVETGREPGQSRQVNAFAMEGIYSLGHIQALNLDTALYVELKHGLRGENDAIELKGLFEHRAGRFDGRLNVIADKPLGSSEPIELGYAALADWAVVGDEVRFGLEAFGDMGTTEHLGGRQEHFVGPIGKFEIEHIGPGDLEIEAGWLKAFGAARDITDGQARLLLEYEAHF